VNIQRLDAKLVLAYREAQTKYKNADPASARALWQDAMNRYVKMSTDTTTIAALGALGDNLGGQVAVYNPFGKLVAEIQSNKLNEGMIGVANVNGDMKNFLSPR
jgi:hypothetical protein